MLDFDDVALEKLANKVTTIEELNELRSLWESAKQAKRLAALGDLRNRSLEMIKVVENMIAHIEFLSKIPGIDGDGKLSDLRSRTGDIHAELHSAGATFTAHDPAHPDPGSDGSITEGATTPAVQVSEILKTPKPSTSKSYAELADEYVRFFNGAGIRSSKTSLVRSMADIAWNNRSRYQSIGQPLGIPWWFIAGLHQMESTYNFDRHMHNGDSLNERTVRVPDGRPISGSPPFTFEESATDALKLKGFDAETDWSLPRALNRFERYNGLGYRPREVPSPYLWSFTTIYGRGKYVSDGTFDANATSQQCGVAALLRQLANDGRIELRSTQFTDVDPPDTAELPANVAPNEILADTSVNSGHTFEVFWQQNLSDIQHFSWKELLFKGASNATHGNNTDPPQNVYSKVVPLVRVLDEIRSRIGGPVRLLSVYRSPAYNSAVGGVSGSRHMEFDAADLQATEPGFGSSLDWFRIAKDLRNEGLFQGGIGLYESFIHVDTRGVNATWDNT